MKFNLKDYGVKENEVQTQKIQEIIDEADQVQGTIVIPCGTYIAGTLNMKGVSIFLEKGAVLKASPNFDDYEENGFVHNEMKKTISFLYSMHNKKVTISGEGTIDLSGEAFYDMETPNIPDYGVVFSEDEKKECTRPISNRPTQPIFFYDCTGVTIKDIEIKNAPCWTMAFHSCDNVRITDVTINNSLIIPNNDGMHFCGSKNVLIKGCNIIAGDDCIALSGITDWYKPCENVMISDCIMKSVSKAVSLGYMHSHIRNVTISNCIIYDSQRGICIMSSKKTGVVEHILIENVRIDTHVRAGNWWGNGEAIEILGLEHHYDGYLHPAPDRNVSVNVRDIQFKNISCSSENVIAILGCGNVEDIHFSGLYFEKKDSLRRYLKGDRVIDVSPSAERIETPDDGEYWLYAVGCKNLTIDSATIADYKGNPLKAYMGEKKDRQ